MSSKSAPQPEEWVSVTRESEGGGLAKREVGMQDVKLRPDGDDDAFSDEGDAEAAPAPSTGSGATSEREGGLHDVKLSDVEAAPAPAPSTASGATSEVAPSTAATTVAAARRISAAGVEHCRTVWRSPVQRVRVAWRATLLLSVFVAVSALVAAAHNDTDAGGRKSAGFAAIWSTFLVLGVIYGGARVLDNSWSSDLARGMFFGVVAMMSQLALCLFAVFIGLAREKRGSDRTDSADHALAAALFLISLCYAVLAGLLGADCQKAIVGQGAAAAAPPPATGAAAPASTPEAPASSEVKSPLA